MLDYIRKEHPEHLYKTSGELIKVHRSLFITYRLGSQLLSLPDEQWKNERDDS